VSKWLRGIGKGVEWKVAYIVTRGW
jgi:hypothetical protein